MAKETYSERDASQPSRPDRMMGNTATTGSYDGSRITPELRGALKDLDPELAAGIRKVADAK